MEPVLFIIFLASAASYKPVPIGSEGPFIHPRAPENPSGPTTSGNNRAQSSSHTESSASSVSSSSSSSKSSSSSQSSVSSYSSSHPSHNSTDAPWKKCGMNEYYVPCKTLCPPQDCAISYTSYLCDPKPKCIPGCDCIKNHLRNNEKKCIFNENCPPPSQEPPNESPQPPNESPQPPNESPQPPNESPKPPKPCSGSTSSESDNAQSSSQSGSNISTSSFSSTSTSSSSTQSSASSSSSSHSSSYHTRGGGPKRSCTYNRCTPTCSLPNPQNCPRNINPCNCPPGTIISEKGGECVQRQECQKYINCNGDYNASYTECPVACPSTCAKPNPGYCDTDCDGMRCACKPGYLLTEINGKCIKPEDCPGGKVCGKNEIFVYCAATCPNNYCPIDDDRSIIACDPPHPCPSGCICKGNYRRLSDDKFICILASDCPPVNCTRPNEEWNPCTGPCFSEDCSTRNKVAKPKDCPYSRPKCSPQCVCKKGIYRNGTEICVTAKECPSDN